MRPGYPGRGRKPAFTPARTLWPTSGQSYQHLLELANLLHVLEDNLLCMTVEIQPCRAEYVTQCCVGLGQRVRPKGQ